MVKTEQEYPPSRCIDSTWRVLDRGVPNVGVPSVDGKDCYLFGRAGGDNPDDEWSIRYIPVDEFWRV